MNGFQNQKEDGDRESVRFFYGGGHGEWDGVIV